MLIDNLSSIVDRVATSMCLSGALYALFPLGLLPLSYL